MIFNIKRLGTVLLVIVFSIVAAVGISGCNSSDSDTYVVMLSLDGFRWDYPEIANTPTLHSIAKNGVTAEALIPCYPSKTFPNHYSMATGLHPDNHGIVCNSFLDEELGYYAIRDRDAVENADFYGGEPIWNTVEKQGLIAATYFWVGSEAPVGGIRPTHWKRYSNKDTFENKIDTVIHWLTLPEEERPRFIAWYDSQPDYIAHRDGPTGDKTIATVERLDSLLGNFLEKIADLPHAHKINLLVVSDHGMADISPEKYINLNDYIDRDWFDIITGGNPVYSLKPKDEFREEAISSLKSIPNLKVWERHEIPERLHYGSNPRIQDIVIEAELGYSVGLSSDSDWYSGGAHGYDNQHPDMHGIFFAQGPAFKKGYKHPAFSNTNLYSIIARILNLEPAETDGNLEDVKGIFEN
ncbi:MAG: ectonucleotide pyrophosphatase/phosphodiesterase [Bacteroidales bacterium]